MNGLRATSRAIIIQDDKILMFERWRTTMRGKRLHYFSIPGGGIEGDESPEEAVIRELYEEMLVKIEPERLLVRQTSPSRLTYYYLCRITSGTPTFNPDSPEYKYRIVTGNRYEIAWLPLENAADKVHHEAHRQVIHLLTTLLDKNDEQPVDISLDNE